MEVFVLLISRELRIFQRLLFDQVIHTLFANLVAVIPGRRFKRAGIIAALGGRGRMCFVFIGHGDFTRLAGERVREDK